MRTLDLPKRKTFFSSSLTSLSSIARRAAEEEARKIAIPQEIQGTHGSVEDYDRKNGMWKIRLDVGQKLAGFSPGYLKVIAVDKEYVIRDRVIIRPGLDPDL